MGHRINTGVAIVLLGSLMLACHWVRPKEKFDWHFILEIDSSVPDREAAVNRAVKVLKTRLDALGFSNFEVQALGTPPNGRILVNLPKVADRERLKKLLSAQGRLELAHVVSPPSPTPVSLYESKEDAETSLGKTVSANHRVLPYSAASKAGADDQSHLVKTRQQWVVVESPVIIDGSELRDASAYEAYSGAESYNIRFSLNSAGSEKFGAWTAANINEYLAVILNEEVKSIAYIKSQISDSGEITGTFTKQAAEDLALTLRSGALPKASIVEEGLNN